MTGDAGGGFPRFHPVADFGIMVEFAESVSEEANDAVLALDAALKARPFPGFAEAIPSYCSLFVGYDPLVAEPASVRSHVAELWANVQVSRPEGRLHEIPVCYDPPFGPDLAAVAERTGLTSEAVIAAHLSGTYRVYMYGFAPGYAYLGGVPGEIRLPRKTAPVRDIPAGSVLVAGPQCLVTTITMPTGWWIIGRSPARILRPHEEAPFLFEVGDRIAFRRVGADALGGGA
ncbi:MAG TPA: 5-oxoprolinase subunit PxpB [Microvirga sp.]|jgi:inhibitor of KinA|nr:5-oxoprolinase subunit PxpB [Microvirga sp.]